MVACALIYGGYKLCAYGLSYEKGPYIAAPYTGSGFSENYTPTVYQRGDEHLPKHVGSFIFGVCMIGLGLFLAAIISLCVIATRYRCPVLRE